MQNKQKIKVLTIITIFFFALFTPYTEAFAEYRDSTDEWNAAVNIPSNKTWTITLNSFVDTSTVNNNSVFVKDNFGEKVKTTVTIGKKDNEVIIQPPANGYKPGEIYSIHITNGVKDYRGKALKTTVTKSFMIERDEVAIIEHTENIIILPEESIVSDSLSETTEPGESSGEMIFNAEQVQDLEVGDVIIIEPNDAYPEGLARKVESLTEINGLVTITTSVPFLDEFIQDLDFNESIAITSEHIDPDSLPREISVDDYEEYDRHTASYFEGLEFSINKFPVIFEKKKLFLTGSIQLQNPVLEPYIKFNKLNASIDNLKFTLKATVVTKLSFDADGSIPAGEPVTFNDIELPMGILAVPIPQLPGLTIDGMLSQVIKTSVIGGLNATIANTSLVEVGIIKNQDRFQPVRTFSNETDLSTKYYGGIETKIGIRAALSTSYLKIKVIQLSTDFGTYGNIKKIYGELYKPEQEELACVAAEIGAFHDIDVSFPAVKILFLKLKFSLYDYKLPLFFIDNCKSLQSINFNVNEIDIDSGATKNINVHAKLFDLNLSATSIENVTNDSIFTTSDPSVTVAPNGSIRVGKSEQDKKVTVTANYADKKGTTKQATLIVNVKGAKPKPTTYLMDKTKEYSWEFRVGGKTTTYLRSYIGPYYGGSGTWDLWKETGNGYTSQFIVLENEYGLYVGYPESEYYKELEYPLYEGKEFEDWFETFTIISLNRIVTTKAGTFHDVVEVKSSYGWTYYYAPNVGYIKLVEYGRTIGELVKITPRKDNGWDF